MLVLGVLASSECVAVLDAVFLELIFALFLYDNVHFAGLPANAGARQVEDFHFLLLAGRKLAFLWICMLDVSAAVFLICYAQLHTTTSTSPRCLCL